MGWLEDMVNQLAAGQNPFGGGASGAGGLPPSPFGGPADPFGTALGEAGLPGAPSSGLPPNPFGGGAGSWPSGVPNPLSLPSPSDMASGINNWFTNPYNTPAGGSVANPSPWNGINPFGHQVSGPAWNSQTTYRPNDPNALQNGWSFNFGSQGQQQRTTPERNDMGGWNPPRPPPQLTQAPIPMTTSDRWGGGIGSGGPGGFRHQQSTTQQGQAPAWHDVPLWQGSK
jgi:hypothetical protein